MGLPLLFAVACGILWSAHDASRKLLVAQIRPLALLVLLAGGAALPFAAWLAIDPTQATPPRPGYLLPAAISVALNVAANLALLRGMRLAPLSLAVPLLSLTPVFTTLVAIPLLGERPSIPDSCGILLVVLGAVFLGSDLGSGPVEAVSQGSSEQALASPSADLAGSGAQRSAGARLRSSSPQKARAGTLGDRLHRPHAQGAAWMAFTALAWSVTPPLDKLALDRSSTPFHAFILTAGVAVIVLFILIALGRARELAGVARVPGIFAFAVISSTLALALQLLAFQGLWVGIVETLKRGIGNVMALILGRTLFGERAGWRAFGAVLAMAAGVALILLAACAPSNGAAPPRESTAPPAAATPAATAPAADTTAAPPATSLPLHTLRLPPGFKIEVWSDQLPGARSMALSPNGVLYVGTRDDVVYAAVDRDGDHRAERVHVIARGLRMPNGVAWRDGALYVAEVYRVLRYDGIDARLESPPEPVVLRDDYPRGRHHGWKFIAFGPDGWLYVPVGMPCNICESEDPIHATITRMSPDGSKREIYAHGIRNTVGFDWHPQTKELWFTENGRDLLGDDVPPDELNRAPRPGLHFGYPYCHGRDISDPEFGHKRPCSELTPPARELGPHVASIGMRFYRGAMFPAEYRGQILIAEHGSWNRSTPIGYRVTRVKLDGDRAVEYEPFVEGWLQGGDEWGRPADVQEMPDGSLLVSDDGAGAVYRVTYAAPR